MSALLASVSPSALVIGIDIGREGAGALLTVAGDLVNVVDMPTAILEVGTFSTFTGCLRLL